MSDLLEKPKDSFARINKEGEIEVVCERTGLILAKRESLKDHLKKLKTPFNETMADIIVNRIIEGETITAICRDPLMPTFSTIARWRRNNEEFNELLKFAYEERAHYHHDRALELAEETATKDEVSVNKLKIETYKWTAERANQKHFATKQVSESGTTITNQIIVTGVPQPDTVEEAVDITPQKREALGSSQTGVDLGEAASDISDTSATSAGDINADKTE